MKNVLLIIFILSNYSYLFSQNTQDIKKDQIVQIDETITTIKKSELSSKWKSFAKDTLSPTYIRIDLNNDNKTDLCGFFTGITSGLIIFDDVENNIKTLYQLNFDSTWFKNEKFEAVMFLKKKGQRVTEVNTGKKIKLKNNSIYVKKFDGTEFIITYLDNEFIKIMIKKNWL
jgi:hypothetical protein